MKFLPNLIPQGFHIIDGIGPAVLSVKNAETILVFSRQPMTEMVVADSDISVLGKEKHERIVTGDMLGYPMRNLNNGFRRFVGRADARKYFVFPVGGRKVKVPDFRHGNFSSPVL